MLAEFAVSALLIASLAYSNSFPLTMLITLVLGFVVQGAQGALGALAATFYPTAIRSTGVGWALGDRPHRLDCRPHARRLDADVAMGPARNLSGRRDSCALRRCRNPAEPVASKKFASGP